MNSTSQPYSLHDLVNGRRPAMGARLQPGWLRTSNEFAGVAIVYVLLAWLGQIAAISPGNITPIYPAAGFAVACVLLRGPRIWPGIWLGQLLGNAWAFVDVSNAGVAATTSIAAMLTACGAVFQALAAGYLIKRWCGSNLFQDLRQLYFFGGIVVIACSISATMGVTALSISGTIAFEDYGYSLLTWYLGDLVGAVLVVPLFVTWPGWGSRVREMHRAVETSVVLLILATYSVLVFGGILPLQIAGNSLLLLTLPLVLWAALRLLQPGVATLVNLIGGLAAFITIQGAGPFVIEDTNLALELLQLFMMVTMIAGLSLTITIEQLHCFQSTCRKLRFAIDHAGHAVLLIRPDGSLEYVNAQATTLLGHSQDALLSMSVCDLDLDFSNQAWPEFWRERLQRGVLHFESVTRRQDGSEVPVAVSVNRLETAGQELACAIVKDISARKRAEESRIRLEQILDSSSAVIYQKNVEGRYEFANRRWGQLFDLQPRDVVGKTDYDLFPREMADAFCRNDQRVIARRQELQIQEVAPHADGPHTYISVKVPVWDTSGRIRGVAGISTDISEQLAAQEELQNSKRLAEIGKMITVLAHECRNSLQRGHACLSMLLREIQEMPKALDYANRLQQAQDDLQHVFDELRSYASRIRLEISRCNLRELIEEAWEQLADVPTHPDVSLRIMESDLDLSCDVDVFRLKQVFRIILENAIGASPTPGVISIEGSCVNLSTGPALRVTVSDQGPGFTPQQQAQAFKAFYTTKVTGTGLGLTIARRIVECHGGQIEIGGDLKTGGTVLITLPQRRVKDGCIT